MGGACQWGPKVAELGDMANGAAVLGLLQEAFGDEARKKGSSFGKGLRAVF